MGILRKGAKRLVPQTLIRGAHRLKYEWRRCRNDWAGIPTAPPGTDWVGYETLVEFIVANDLLSVEGDLLEIGTFLGGGAYVLSKFLEKRAAAKRLVVLDVFNPKFDWTANTAGNPMATLYLDALRAYGQKSQWDVFSEVTRACSNIQVLKQDSKQARLPVSALCFAFIDGNHAPDYVENDFHLAWEKMSPKAGVAFHDYGGDLPQTTQQIDELMGRHVVDIERTSRCPEKQIFFAIRK